MNRRLSYLVLFAAVLILVGCSSTRFLSSEKAKDVEPVDLKGQKVVALVIDPREEIRTKAENALASELTRRGLVGVAAHEVLAADIRNDKDKVKAAIHDSGAQALVTVCLIGTKEQDQYMPGTYDRGVDFYGTGWGINYAPGYYDSYDIFIVETRCYRVADEKLLWSGVSKTVDPGSVKSLVKSLAKEAGKVMAKQGLVKKE